MDGVTICLIVVGVLFVVCVVLGILIRRETRGAINQVNGDTITPFGKYLGGLPDANKAVDILDCVITNTGSNDSLIFLDNFGQSIGGIPIVLIEQIFVNGSQLTIAWQHGVVRYTTVFQFSGNQAVGAANALLGYIQQRQQGWCRTRWYTQGRRGQLRRLIRMAVTASDVGSETEDMMTENESSERQHTEPRPPIRKGYRKIQSWKELDLTDPELLKLLSSVYQYMLERRINQSGTAMIDDIADTEGQRSPSAENDSTATTEESAQLPQPAGKAKRAKCGKG
jgi:hypothetical protein